MKILFWESKKYAIYEKARVFVNRHHPLEYLKGQQGYVLKVYEQDKAMVADVRLLLDEGEHYYTHTISLKYLILESPEKYPAFKKVSKGARKKGGEWMMGNMPRLFQFFVYAAIVYLVWHFATHIDLIANFFVHLFLK